MSKEKKQIEKEDLLPADVYAESRKKIRRDLVEFKVNTGALVLILSIWHLIFIPYFFPIKIWWQTIR